LSVEYSLDFAVMVLGDGGEILDVGADSTSLAKPLPAEIHKESFSNPMDHQILHIWIR